MRNGVVSGVNISRGWRGWEMSVSSLKKRSDSLIPREIKPYVIDSLGLVY